MDVDARGGNIFNLGVALAEKLKIDSNAASGGLLALDTVGIDSGRAGKIKAAICGDLAKDTGLDAADISEVIHQWANTSNDTCYASLHIQKMVAEEFGVGLSDFQQQQLKKAADARDYFLKELNGDRELLRAFVFGTQIDASSDPNVVIMHKGKRYEVDKQVYSKIIDKGHKDFPSASRRGSDNIMSDADTRKVLRAMYNRTQKMLASAKLDKIRIYRGVSHPPSEEINPNKIHVYKGNACESFSISPKIARGFGKFVIDTVVPKERVLGSFLTGFGCTDELEFVVLGGRGKDKCRLSRGAWI